MEYLYINSTFFPPSVLAKVEKTSTIYPKKELEGYTHITHNGKKYELLDVFQERLDRSRIKQSLLIIKTVFEICISFLNLNKHISVENRNKAIKFLKDVIAGRKIIVVYKEIISSKNSPSPAPNANNNPQSTQENQKKEEPSQKTTKEPTNQQPSKGPTQPSATEKVESSKQNLSASSIMSLKKLLKPENLIETDLVIGGIKTKFAQIRTLDQNFEKGGYQRCGYHSFKNLLAIIGLINNQFDSTIFNNIEFYSIVRTFIEQFQSVHLNLNSQDACIANLAEAWRNLLAKQPLCFSNEENNWLIKVQKVIDTFKTSVSMFSYFALDQFKKGIFPGGGLETGGEFISNFGRFVKAVNTPNQKKLLQHIFLMGSGDQMGSQDHWTCVVFEKPPGGEIQWYGLDSYGNQRVKLVEHIIAVTEIMKNSEKFIMGAYENQL